MIESMLCETTYTLCKCNTHMQHYSTPTKSVQESNCSSAHFDESTSTTDDYNLTLCWLLWELTFCNTLLQSFLSSPSHRFHGGDLMFGSRTESVRPPRPHICDHRCHGNKPVQQVRGLIRKKLCLKTVENIWIWTNQLLNSSYSVLLPGFSMSSMLKYQHSFVFPL